jgi:hypothetical protein
MYYNKITIVRSDRIQMPDHPEDYDIYQNYIDELDPSVRFEKYYFASPFLSVKQYKEHLEKLGDAHNYETSVPIMIKNMIESEDINNDLEQGNTCIIFDMGVELVPEDVYRMVDEHFSKSKFHNNVKYWTMYENCNWEGTVEIVSASRTALRYGDWNYNTGLETKDVQNKAKHFLSLNRRMRGHRILLMAELIKRKIDISKDFYLSFLGSVNDVITEEKDKDTIMGISSFHKEQYEEDIFTKICEDVYGKKLPYNTEVDRDEWFGSSHLDRVTEMFSLRQKTYVEIITEFTASDDGLVSISEKLSQAILSKKPFIIVGDKGFMTHLRKLGFKTFHNYWSEDYDWIHWVANRIVSIGDTIEYIQNNISIETDNSGNVVYGSDMQEILEHNYNHYKEKFVCDVDNRILTSLSIDNKLKMKPGLAYNEVNEIKQDELWYNENTNIVIIPTQTKLVLHEISPRLGFKLISVDEIDLKKTRIIALTRDPRKSIISQTNLIKDYSVSCTIDIDKPSATGYYYDWDWGRDSHGEREMLKEISKILERTIDNEQTEINNEPTIEDLVFYFTHGSWRNRKPYNMASIEGKFKIWIEKFSEENSKMIEYFKNKGHSVYFNSSLHIGFWKNHCMFMKNVGLNYAPKDIKILDMGTHFGFIPLFLKSEGFINVDSTNSFKEAGDMLGDLKKMWNTFDISPMNVHIELKEKFKLDKKYDVILATQTNILWKTNKIIQFTQNSVSQSSVVIDEDGIPVMTFVPYELEDLDFFIENIMEYLEPGGIAVIQPYPYVYDTFDGFKEEAKFLKSFQNYDQGYEYPQATKHTPTAELSNYFVVQKMK